ncbi:hypothetical protein [Mesorhizobium sp. CAU 1741]|uniref:hypothetical protein n=1 Tax=Mesorhizobium sp. CAU 1741 TaxID=3140366 RepID=UPI00325B8D3B
MRMISTAVAAIGIAVLANGTAMAGGGKDRVYADSFGNLVIHSPAGYKRVIVGQGYAAEAYNLTGSYYEPEEPDVVYLDEQRTRADVRYCHRPPYRWHGRSYMCGLPDHVVPQAPLVCE